MDRPNVLVLLFDTLRADAVTCGGDLSVETPHFDALAAESVSFTNAFAAGPGTPVSHAALYTGQYPSTNGVMRFGPDLPADRPVLAEWLRDHGYDTFGITGPAKMGSDYGYDRGFEELYEPYYELGNPGSLPFALNLARSRIGRRELLRTLTKGGKELTRFRFDLIRNRIDRSLAEPFFVFCNFLTVHAPYEPPRPYLEGEIEGFSRPRLFLAEHLLNSPGTVDRPDVDFETVRHAQTGDGMGRFMADPDWLTDAEREVLRDCYGACVRHLDEELGRFLAYYRRELAEDTILVVTADHGEQLGEHGLRGHSQKLVEETQHVPLFVAGPGLPKGEERTDFVSLVDLFDTICDLAGVPRPETTEGRSIFAGPARERIFMERGPGFDPDNVQYQYMDDDQTEEFLEGRKAVRDDEHKFVVTSSGRELFFEVPSERLIDDPDPDLLAEYREVLNGTLGGDFLGRLDPEETGKDVSSERVEKQLRDLGYHA
jgi:arylsulfatase A-like enzyme